MSDALFVTQRSKLVEAYKNAGQPFNANTKPYKSTASFLGVTVQAIGTSAAFLVFGAQQRVEWFGYGLGQAVAGTSGLISAAGLTAMEDDTNLSKARSTNGAEDFVIEGISASRRNVRAAWTTTAIATSGISGGIASDSNVNNALNGLLPLLDPAALFVPPQVSSPFNLEETLMTAIAPHIAIEFEWDRQRVEKIGTLDQIPEGAAKSFLRANGDPRTDNRYRIPEGYLWRRDGQTDSEFIVRGTLQRAVIIPLSTVTFPTTLTTAQNAQYPTACALDIVLRLHGLSVRLPSHN